jgi:hypothetical protein
MVIGHLCSLTKAMLCFKQQKWDFIRSRQLKAMGRSGRTDFAQDVKVAIGEYRYKRLLVVFFFF